MSKPVTITAFCLLVLLLQITPEKSSAQEPAWFYRVTFTDKGDVSPGDFDLEDLFSSKTVTRRIKSGKPDADYFDLPVSQSYISSILLSGLKLKSKSRWMNSALFTSQSELDITAIENLPFVENVKTVKHPLSKGSKMEKFPELSPASDFPPFDRPLTMLSGDILRESGITGKGITVAVLDGGFYNADIIPSLGILRYENRILGTYDFVKNSSFVYGFHTHGTAVLSILAGDIQGQITGSATGADYWLLRTEDTNSEFPVEEDYWAAGAEFADSVGADIISSSLGYYQFDDAAMDYKFSDMDGNTAFVTRAADIAATRGIVVVASAGNERNKAWKRIIAPSDGDSVLAIAAVDGDMIISSFSSAGPSADRRVKPDISAQGVRNVLQTEQYTLSRGSGTSFSCPVISGMCASIMEAVPEAKPFEIIEAFRKSADRYSAPDSLYGYGIPDVLKVLETLQDKYLLKPDENLVLGPNPTTGELRIILKDIPERVLLTIYSHSGNKVAEYDLDRFTGRELLLTDLKNKPDGLYILHLSTSSLDRSFKILKIGD